jgi:hypothetical protein
MNAWLQLRTRDAPERLRQRMLGALTESASASANASQSASANASQSAVEQMVAAAFLCLRRALQQPSERASALDLLAADALLTHACELAAELGELTQLVAKLDDRRFAELLTT